jgi:hypothetical protein
VQVWLRDQQQGVMSWLYNTYSFLKVIRSEEHIDQQARWIDTGGQVLEFDSTRIQIAKFRSIVMDCFNRYAKFGRKKVSW